MMKKLHRLNAMVLGVFLTLHLVNHLMFVIGPSTHLAMMENLRVVYRQQLVEILIIGLFAAQIILGLVLVWSRGRPTGRWAWAQAISGLYLAFFLLQHVGATLAARGMYAGFDTNTWFALGVVSRAPFLFYFAPYYFLAIVAIFVHVAAALRFRKWQQPATGFQKTLPVIGIVFGAIVVGAMIGHAADGVPQTYQDYLNSFGL